MKTLRSKKDSFQKFADVLRNGESFKTYGALRGFAGSTLTSSFGGRLPDEYWTGEGQPVDYVVYSYATPIAWRRAVDGEWIIPDVRYSVTTSQHQGKIRAAISVLSEEKGE